MGKRAARSFDPMEHHPKNKTKRHRLTSSDLGRISQAAKAHGLTDEDVTSLVRLQFFKASTERLPSADVRRLIEAIELEGARRKDIRERRAAEEKARKEAAKLAELERQEATRARVRASRKDWASRSNPARLEAKRRRRKAHRG